MSREELTPSSSGTDEDPALFSNDRISLDAFDSSDDEIEERMAQQQQRPTMQTLGFNPMQYRLGGTNPGASSGGSTRETTTSSGISTMNFRRFMFHDSDSDEEWTDPKTIEEKRKLYRCGAKYVTLDKVKPFEDYAKEHGIKNVKKKKRLFAPNTELNKKISLFQGDSTAMEIDAIVNAANSSLLGGGGIDGAIHSAAGSQLRKECATLNGCATGFTKITKGYKLPAKQVLHTVGPINEEPDKLESCYRTCLQLVEQHNIKTVGFCCIATGIFGFPLYKATRIALTEVRKWLETNENYKKVDRIIFVVYLAREVKAYEKLLPAYFPLPLTKEEEEAEANAKDEEEESDEEEDEDTPQRFGGFGGFGGFAGYGGFAGVRRPPSPTQLQQRRQILAQHFGVAEQFSDSDDDQ